MFEADRWLVLFVEPDAAAAAATQRLLRRLCPHWQVELCSDAVSATQYLLQQAVAPQMLITDRLDDSLRGEELLEFCAEHSPATIRVLMSAENDGAVLLAAVQSAQMLLGKPFTEWDLQAIFQRAEQIIEGPFSEHARYQLGTLQTLPIQQKQYQQILNLLDDPDSSQRALAAALEREAPLAGRLIQMANSAYLGFRRQTLDLQEVTSRLGREMIKAIMQAFMLHQQYQGRIQPQLHQQLQDYAVALASVAFQLARTQCRDDASLAEKAYAAGLMQALGPLALLATQPLSSQQLTQEDMFQDGVADHCVLTGYLMTLWGFSADVCAAAMYRLDLQSSPHIDRLQAILHLASYVLCLQQQDPTHANMTPDIEALNRFALTNSFLTADQEVQ
ncbi:HDOD domain-containing protein [Rheinheimera texasensis]|uniref:HDOD domain-containing protein n=1 Tax=Rheinheimera texasensis TaxID=306205 RepID=UPI0032B1447F